MILTEYIKSNCPYFYGQFFDAFACLAKNGFQ